MGLLVSANVLPVFETAVYVACLFSVTLASARAIALGRARFLATFLSTFVAAFAFSLLGFVTGSIMANSREASVAAVLPAVLTLLGGVLAYLIGTKGYQKQASVSGLVICFVGSLYIGTTYGSILRNYFDDTAESLEYLHARALGLESNRHAVDVQRLQNYIQLMKLKKQFADEEGLDLNGFKSSAEATERAEAKSK